MTRYTGQCKGCGDSAHPKGNVFHIEATETGHVKVCNNCGTEHPFHRRVSAKAKARNDLVDWLISLPD